MNSKEMRSVVLDYLRERIDRTIATNSTIDTLSAHIIQIKPNGIPEQFPPEIHFFGFGLSNDKFISLLNMLGIMGDETLTQSGYDDLMGRFRIKEKISKN